MAHAFISYSHRDRAFVEKLYADLTANGIDVWVDIYNLQPGVKWDDALLKALQEATAIIIVLSSSSIKSENLQYEVLFARENEVQLLPILIEDGEIPLDIARYQFVDFRDSTNYQQAFARLLGALKSLWDFRSEEEPPQEQDFVQSEEIPEPANKGRIFLSYVGKDADFIEQFKAFLKQRGYIYWDYRESNRDYDTELYRELEDRIEESAALVSILTDSWRDTPWAARELVYAEEARKPVFIVQAKPLKRPVPILINLRTRFDLSGKNYTKEIEKLGREFDQKGL